MVKILVCDPIHEDGIKILREAGITVDLKLNLTQDELEKIVKDYDGIIVRSKTKITGKIMEKASNLKFVGRVGVGLDNIDILTAKRLGIKVLSTPKATSQSVAELTIGLMITAARKIALASQTVKEGKWEKNVFMGSQLQGKTLGIIGFGRIGIKVAKMAKALGMKILVYDVAFNKQTEEIMEEFLEDAVSTEERLKALNEFEGSIVSFEELLTNSDVISLHVPLTEKTKHLIGEKEFSLMKRKPILINTARGALIDEKALYEALKSEKISAVGLDVYEVEPPKNLEMLNLPNVVCTPHIGAQTKEAQKEASIQIAEKILKFLKEKK
ncbi:MAG: 3-phosphoglycerate dehydrogenase [Candidatus Hecatellales archaeon ex4484_218]|nr:MAG: 3-phosphoglycerate dehydrogenase [Candidatus Hecatellales archaeon ex4484_218]